jgi:hypothetical protein
LLYGDATDEIVSTVQGDTARTDRSSKGTGCIRIAAAVSVLRTLYLELPGNWKRARDKKLFFAVSTASLGSVILKGLPPPCRITSGDFFREEDQQGCQEINNEWSCTSTPLYVSMARRLI